MIAERYIIRSALRPLAAICGVLIFIFGCYMAARYWAHAAHGKLPGSVVMTLIGLRSLIALELLLPTALFFSVVIAMDRMIRQSEMLALFACGIGLGKIVKAVVMLSLVIFSAVLIISLWIRPWAWSQFFETKARAKASFDLTRMKPGVFYEIWDGKRVIFAQEISRDKNRARGIFIKTRAGGAQEGEESIQVIYARSAKQVMDRRSGNPLLILKDGREYELSLSGQADFVMEFESSRMLLEPRKIELEEKIKAVATRRLLSSHDREGIAELQWRLLMPISSVLLALCALGICLRFTSPRRGRSISTAVAIVVFALFYNLMAISKKWLAQGRLPAAPGLGVGLLALAAFTIVLFWPHIRLLRSARMARSHDEREGQ